MNLFVTGASGFIGKNFCKKALKAGHKIFAPTRKKKFSFTHRNMIWLKGEFFYNWKKSLSNSHMLVHFAASGVKSDYENDIYDLNIFQSLKLFKNAVSNKCKNWLLISTSSEYGFKKKKTYFSIKTNRIPETNYGLSKAIFTDECKKLAKKHKCKLRIMRLFSIYGSGENKKRLYPSLIYHIKNNKNFYVKKPNEIRDFTHVDYATTVILNALNFKKKEFKHNQIWHVSKNETFSVKKFVKQICKINNAKNRLFFNKKNKKSYNHLSDKKSVWK